MNALNQAQFNELVGRIKARQVLLNKDIQTCAMFCVELSVRDRNSTNANTLFHALGKGMRRQSLVAYFEKMGNLCYAQANPKTGKKQEGIYFFDVFDMTGEEPGMLGIVGWEQVKWYEASKETIVSSIDIRADVKKLLDRVRKAQKKHDREVVGEEYIKLLEVIASGDDVTMTEV